MKPKVRFFLKLALILAFSVPFVFPGVLYFSLKDFPGSEALNRDYEPDAAKLQSLAAPASIYRIIEAVMDYGMSGDADSVKIYCFREGQIEEMKVFLSGGSETAQWQPGLPTDGNWRSKLNDYTPAELEIPESADQGDYIHSKSGQWHWRIIDIKTFVGYELMISI